MPAINMDDEDAEPKLKLRTEITYEGNDEERVVPSYDRLNDMEEGNIIVRLCTSDVPLVLNPAFEM